MMGELYSRVRPLLRPGSDLRYMGTFARYCGEATRRNIRSGCLVLAAVTLVAWPLDLLLDAATARDLAMFRLATVALAALYGVAFARLPALSRRPHLAASLVVVVAVVGQLCNAERAGLALPWNDHSYLLPFVTLLGLDGLRRRVLATLGVSGGFIGAYFWLFPGELSSPHAWSFVVTMGTASLVSLTVGHILYSLSWRQHALACELDRANRELEQRVVWQTRELQALNDRTVQLHEAERSRVARALGGRADGLVERMRSELAAMAAPPQGSVVLERVGQLTLALQSSLRRIVSDLAPEAPEGRDLAAELIELVRTMRPLTAATLRDEVDDGLVGLGSEVALSLYRIAQEALNNAIRHASASSITLRAQRRGRGLTMEIVDDGEGLRAPASSSRRGLGLATMHERAQQLGATLRVEPRVGGGTRIILALAALERRAPPAARSGSARR